MNPLMQQATNDQANGSGKLPDTSAIQYAHFRVANLDRFLPFYKNLLGLVESGSEGNTVTLSAFGGAEPLVKVTEDPSIRPRKTQAPGLFHLALLYPNRKALAAAFKRLYVQRWPFQGFADHGVSEALYLADADGNGIELYVDRPREEWPYRNGELQMVTEPLDLDNLLSELSGDDADAPSTSTGLRIGHIHLQVSDLARAEEFYHHAVGFDITQRNFPGALFMSAGGYHHHIGANIWNSRGAAPADDTSAGLVGFGIRLGTTDALKALYSRLHSTPYWVSGSESGFTVRDADHVRIYFS